MKISAIELYHVSVPLGETFWPTWIPGYPQTHNRFTLIKIMFEKDCFDIYQPDATFAGGIAQVRQVMEMCRQKKRPWI